MDRLPPEVLHLILQELAELDGLVGPSYASNMSIKAMRLCCRTFADLAPKYLYHDLWLYMEKDSFAKLKAVAGHPKYRLMVRVLTIFPKLLSPDLLIKKDYKKCVKAISFNGHGHQQWGFDANGYRKLSKHQLDAGFAQYTRLYEDQQDTLRTAQNLLSDALSAFTKLTWVAPGFVDELLDDDTFMSNLRGKIQTMARTTHMAVDCAGWQTEIHGGEHAFAVLIALASSSCKMYGLDLDNKAGPFEFLMINIPDYAYEAARKVLRHVRSLSIQMPKREGTLQELEDARTNGNCANLLKLATSVEDLYVGYRGSSAMILYFDHTFGTIRWSNLRYVSISTVSATHDELNDFMERHSETLEDIALDMIILHSGSWKNVFSGMRRRKALKNISIRDLWTKNTDLHYDLTTWREEWQALLDGFVFEGKDWPSELDAEYSQEAK